MVDTLAPRALIGVMTPAMNTVVQPELELLKPAGVTNQMQRFRLGGDRISDDLAEEAEKLMDCSPRVMAIGLTTDAGENGVAKLSAVCDDLADKIGIPVCNASIATQEALRHLKAQRIAVLTPFNAEVDKIVKANIESGGFEVIAIKGTEAPSLPAICETSLEDIRQVALQLAESDCDAIAQIGTALPLVGMLDELERQTGKPVVACNAALYWQALNTIGMTETIDGMGALFKAG